MAPRDYDEKQFNRFGGDRLRGRQVDELVGVARALSADGEISIADVEFLSAWLASNVPIVENPVVRILYDRVIDILADGEADADERADLLHTLRSLVGGDQAPGEATRATDLPLCNPPPTLFFDGWRYCFTGTFNFGKRAACEDAVSERGAAVGSLTKGTRVLVIGEYATESWKHSAWGNKVNQACDWRKVGHPISIVCEQHWRSFL